MQSVKKYVDIVGDRRVGTESKTAVEQINQDLRENRNWQIHSLIISDYEFYVVYNIVESRVLVEEYKHGILPASPIHGLEGSIESRKE